MELLPRSGERLWIDDLAHFHQKNSECGDPLLRDAAQSFVTNGFVLLKSVVSDGVINPAIAAYEEWCAGIVDGGHVRGDERRPRIVNLHSSRVELKQIFTRSETVLKVLDYLFGYKTSVYTSLIFQFGTEQPIHRDTPVFRTEPENFYFGVWFALEDADALNGALLALKGAHRGGLVDPYSFAKRHLSSIEEQTATGAPPVDALSARRQDCL